MTREEPAAGLDAYPVGGCVRDELLGLPSQDRDWVVVGATPELMLRRGFRQVGRDFPVFLHPRTNEEYALARTERKRGQGYRGFEIHAAPDVTLEADLQRRDFTINAMARGPDGRLIDPFGGAADLQQGVLRHVGPAFVEDPLRVLRLARFAARFDFRVHPDTLALAQEISRSGELRTLAPERIWQELAKSLLSRQPDRFVEVLRETGALAELLPEVDALFGVPQPEHYHPEIDTGAHILLAMRMARQLSPDPRVGFAVLVHDLGKARTSETLLPRHIGHEGAGVPLVERLCDRLRVPNDFRRLAVKVTADHRNAHRIAEQRPTTQLALLERLDAFRRPQEFELFLLACEADACGRLGLQQQPYPQAGLLRRLREIAAAVPGAALADEGLSGAELAKRLRQQRLQAIASLGEPTIRPDEVTSDGT